MQKFTEQRSSKRNTGSESIQIYYDTDANKKNSQANIVDISATGIGLSTAKPLKKGQTVWFEKNHPNWSLPDRGVVVWSIRSENQFRIGLKFLL